MIIKLYTYNYILGAASEARINETNEKSFKRMYTIYYTCNGFKSIMHVHFNGFSPKFDRYSQVSH